MTHWTAYVTKPDALNVFFHRNNYNADFIRQNICRLTEADATNRNPTPVTTPYIWGTSETISRILQPHNIREAHKPTTTLGHLLTSEEQMLRLPGFPHCWDWQKPQHETDWTETSHQRWWCQQSRCCTSSTNKPQHWLRTLFNAQSTVQTIFNDWLY